MRKTVLAPGYDSYGDGDARDDSNPATSLGQVVHRPDGMAVTLSGLVHPADDVEDQARALLSLVRRVVCDDLGGELADVTMLRYYVRDDALTLETRSVLRRVRRQTFEWPHYPATTTVGVASLGHDDALVEMETEAFVPDDGWETEVLEPEG